MIPCAPATSLSTLWHGFCVRDKGATDSGATFGSNSTFQCVEGGGGKRSAASRICQWVGFLS